MAPRFTVEPASKDAELHLVHSRLRECCALKSQTPPTPKKTVMPRGSEAHVLVHIECV
jgi:hypothetical protein